MNDQEQLHFILFTKYFTFSMLLHSVNIQVRHSYLPFKDVSIDFDFVKITSFDPNLNLLISHSQLNNENR